MGRGSLLVFALAVGGLMTLGADQASASSVSCGETITADTTLDNDLVDCPNNGIVIGADNVMLDLNGHTVDGDGEVFEPCQKKEFCDVGVVSEGHDGVTIKGGRFKEFFVGVSVIAAKRAHLRQLAVTRNILGVGVFDSRRAHLRRLTASHNVDSGIILVNAARSALSRSSANANGLDTDQAGMGLFESHDVTIKRTSLSRNGDIGLLAEQVNDVRFVKNKVTHNPEVGVLMEGDGNEITRNRLVRNGNGIAFDGGENAIKRNHVIKTTGGFGITFEGLGDDTRIARNKVRGARDGILVGPSFGRHGEDTKVIGNRVRGVGRDGMRVGTKAHNTLLRRNHTSGADDDGIDVRRADTTLTENRANRNADLGIEAVAGVTDGGGNAASGNGNPAQCVNVACSP